MNQFDGSSVSSSCNETGEPSLYHIGEVKYTTSTDYTITGLRELVDYMKLIKDKKNNFLDENAKVEIYGMLFSDCKLANDIEVAKLLNFYEPDVVKKCDVFH